MPACLRAVRCFEAQVARLLCLERVNGWRQKDKWTALQAEVLRIGAEKLNLSHNLDRSKAEVPKL